jgi:tol-pal system protein YbgF
MSKFFTTAGFAAALLIVAGAAPAAAGTKDDLRNLQDRMARVEQAAAAQSAATVRLSELERQNQFLTGRIEELSFQLDQANQRLDAIGAALAGDGAGDLGGATFSGGPGYQQQGPVALAPGDPIADQLSRTGVEDGPGAASVELPLDPAAAFDYASGFLLKGDYQRAKAAFGLYVEAFPNHARTPDARFRLGEIHLALGENADAADVFIAHIRAYPNDPRAAEAYLKLGTAFSRLEKSDQACTVFKTMKAKFPNASQPVRQRADLEMSRINCQ